MAHNRASVITDSPGSFAGIHAPDWYAFGLCAQTDPELFFPHDGQKPDVAIGVCRRCPVVNTCGLAAIESGEGNGIWGGMTEKDRNLIITAKGLVENPLRLALLRQASANELDLLHEERAA